MTSKPSTAIPPPTRLNQAGLARLLGVKRQSINELVQRGIITVDGDGLIDIQAARVAIAHKMRPDSKALAVVVGQPAIEPESAPPAEADPPPPQQPADEYKTDPSVTSFHVARTLDMSARAKKAQLDLAERQGLLIERAQIDRDLFTIARELRNRHTTTARRIAAELANTTNAEACETVLLREFNLMLKHTVSALATLNLGQDLANSLDLA